jgi:Fe2+ or Zn2+ uptake regulation protein
MDVAHRRLRKSKQRDRILSILKESTDHPTAAEVYDRIKDEFPSASLGNVYRNLNILVDQGSIRRFASGSTFDRFEAASTEHSHFRCRRCGRIYDIPAPALDTSIRDVQTQQGHSVEEFRLELEGVCAACRKNQREA